MSATRCDCRYAERQAAAGLQFVYHEPWCESLLAAREQAVRYEQGEIARLRAAKPQMTCPTCAPKKEDYNHPTGMIFVGWGHGWQVCPACGGSTSVPAVPAPSPQEDARARQDSAKNFAWLRAHGGRAEYQHAWVALRAGALIDSDTSRVALQERLGRAGLADERTLVVKGVCEESLPVVPDARYCRCIPPTRRPDVTRCVVCGLPFAPGAFVP